MTKPLKERLVSEWDDKCLLEAWPWIILWAVLFALFVVLPWLIKQPLVVAVWAWTVFQHRYGYQLRLWRSHRQLERIVRRTSNRMLKVVA